MARRWRCVNGHSDKGHLALPACPVCGLPVTVEQDLSAVASRAAAPAAVLDDTLVGQLQAGQGFTPPIPGARADAELGEGAVEMALSLPLPSDGIDPSSRPGRPTPDQTTRNFPPPQPPRDNGNGGPSSHPAPKDAERPAVVNWLPLVSLAGDGPLSEHPTLIPPPSTPPAQALLQGAPATARPGGAAAAFVAAPVTAQAPPEQHHGETLVRPTITGPSRPTSSVPATAAPAPDSGGISGYELLGVLGRGGMGVVYKARQKGLNRLVALKMILAGSHASAEELKRFKIEAEAVAHLQHPNIVQIYEIDERDGRPYFSLEYCEGGSLQQKLDGTPMPPQRAAALLETLARAMDFAHQRGIVHRDLKPANVLLTADGTPKITDFGLAKRLEDQQGHTGTEAVLGTPTYMAPEQASGKTREVGPAADIYSLGALFYDLLTGRPPFRGTTALDTLQLVQNQEPIPPSRLQPGVPLDLQTICLKCLEKEPQRRYASAGDLADDLHLYLDGQPIKARPTSALERGVKWVARKPVLAALLATLILFPLVVAGVSVYFTVQLTVTNAELTLERNRIAEQNTLLEQQGNTLTQQMTDIKEKGKKLKLAMDDLKVVNDRVTGEKKAANDAREQAEFSYLRAMDAMDELIKTAREELNHPGLEKARRGVLQRVIQLCQSFTAGLNDSHPAQLRAARGHRRIGELEADFGHNLKGIEHLDVALGFYEKLRKLDAQKELPGVSVDIEIEMVETLFRLWTLLEVTQSARAPEVLRTLKANVERLRKPANPKAALPSRRSQAVLRQVEVLLQATQGIYNHLHGRLMDAGTNYNQAVELLKAALRVREGDPHLELELARVLVNRAALHCSGWDRLEEQGAQGPSRENLDRAAEDGERATELLNRLLTHEPRAGKGETPLSLQDKVSISNILGQAYVLLGLVRVWRNEPTLALRNYEKAVDLFTKLPGGAERLVDTRYLLARARGNRGVHLLRMGRVEPGQKDLQLSRVALEALAKATDVPLYGHELARLATNVGVVHQGQGNLVAALRSFNEAAEVLEKLLQKFSTADDLRRDLLMAYRNCILCNHALVFQSGGARNSAAVIGHVKELAKLRQRYEKALPVVAKEASWWRRGEDFWKRLSWRVDQVDTLRALAGVRVRVGDHEGGALAIKEMRDLVAPTWPDLAESAELLCRCVRQAEQDRVLGPTERTRTARKYAQQAVEVLRPLVRADVPGLAEQVRNGAFDALRDVLPPGEFRQLQGEKRK